MKLPDPRTALALLALAMPVAAQTGEKPPAPKSHIIIVKDYLGKDRIIHDADGDGWDDTWCIIFSGIKHRNKTQDTDGDGLTDYEEMILKRDPFVEGPLPREATPEEIAEAKAAAEAAHRQAVQRWNDKVAAARAAGVRELISAENPETDPRIAARTQAIENLKLEAANAAAVAPAQHLALETKANELGIPLYHDAGNGTKALFGGQTEDGNVIFTGSHMDVHFGTIGANRYYAIPEVWPDLGGTPAPLAAGSIIGSDAGAGFAWLSTDLTDGFVSEDEIGLTGTFLVLVLNSGVTGTFFPGYEKPLRAFLGIEFESDEGTHYGYLDIYMPAGWEMGYIMGWAYESEPGKAIVARPVPEPSYALLAGAGLALMLARRSSCMRRIQTAHET